VDPPNGTDQQCASQGNYCCNYGYRCDQTVCVSSSNCAFQQNFKCKNDVRICLDGEFTVYTAQGNACKMPQQ
jgi:hypothetical protein